MQENKKIEQELRIMFGYNNPVRKMVEKNVQPKLKWIEVLYPDKVKKAKKDIVSIEKLISMEHTKGGFKLSVAGGHRQGDWKVKEIILTKESE